MNNSSKNSVRPEPVEGLLTDRDYLQKVKKDFDTAIQLHQATLLAVLLSLELGFDAETNPSSNVLLERLHRATKCTQDLEVFLEYLQSSETDGFFNLRKNFLLGICSAFEGFVCSCIALGEASLKSVSDDKFYERFQGAESKVRNKNWDIKFGFIKCQPLISWAAEETKAISDVFWLRNQFTHNLNKAKEDRKIHFLNTTYKLGDNVGLDSALLNKCLKRLEDAVKKIDTHLQVSFKFSEI